VVTYNNKSTEDKIPIMVFQPGNEHSKGRPAGARNRTSYELREKLKARGGKDPAEFLSDIISDKTQSTEVRVAASGQLMPYYHSKLGATPVPPSPVYVQEAVSLPKPTTIQLAYENIAHLAEMKALGKLDLATADSLINDQRVILNALIDEAKLIAAQGPTSEMTIRIEGGLPTLPGTNIAMPLANGHELPNPGSPMIDHQSQSLAQEPGPEISSEK
jgi:hypothetical protein